MWKRVASSSIADVSHRLLLSLSPLLSVAAATAPGRFGR
jgi:hypothetical protein